jgi:Na+-driven multidrug efflux pump
MQLWVLTSMLVDSLAVAGQTLIAVKLSGGQSVEARQVAERLLQLGLALGLGIAGVLGVSSPLWPRVFTSDTGVLDQIRALVPLAVLPLPINALVYTLDGVLVGASDFG